MSVWHLPNFILARRRLFAALLCAVVAVPFMPSPAITRAICAWDVGVTLYLALSIILFCSEPQARMADNARAQQEGEWTIFSVTIGVVVVSFLAILGEFAQSKDLSPAVRGLHVALVVYTLLASWLMTHTSFCFRYAHEFYTSAPGQTEIDGGLEFPGEKNPDYLDFAYFSLVLGMTFQVSDVQITSRKLRRLAAVQGFLSFMFNTVIVALTVNIAANLL